MSAARNAALDRASGDYVVFADADDTVCPDWLEVLAKEAETSGADIVVSGFFSTDSNGKALDTVLPPEEGNITGKEFLGNFYAHQSNHGLPGFGHGKIVRRDLIEKNNIRFTPGLKLAEDLDFFVRLYDKAETVRTVRYAGYNYLQGAENSTGGSSAYRVDYLSQVKIWLGIVSILTVTENTAEKTGRLLTKSSAGTSAVQCCTAPMSTARPHRKCGGSAGISGQSATVR